MIHRLSILSQLWLYLTLSLWLIIHDIIIMLLASTNTWEPVHGFMDAAEGLFCQPIAGPNQTSSILLTSEMSFEHIIACLIQHGCNDFTGSIDPQRCNLYPFTRGGFSAIYLSAFQNGRPIAIKCVESFRNCEDSHHALTSGKNLKRAAREIYTWSRCNYPGVLPVLGFARFRGQIALITPWMESGSLHRHILGNLLPTPLQTCIQITVAVEYLHASGVVHGDIKPDNILMTSQGRAQLADFGSALSTVATALDFTRTKSCSFTTQFTAPEILREEGSVFTQESDIYALGMTIFNIMSGQPPFAGRKESSIIIGVVVNKIQPLRPDFRATLQGDIVKDKMWDLLKRCFAYTPSDRPKSGEVKEALIELEGFNSDPN